MRLGISNNINNVAVTTLFGEFNINSLSPEVWLAFNKGQGAITDGIQWNDQSANENHASQTADAQEGAFSSGVYRVDAGSNDNLDFASQIDLTGSYHVFMALNLSEQTNETFLSSTNSSTSFMRLGQGDAETMRLRQNTSSNQANITMSVAFGTDLGLIEVARDSSNDVKVIRNGTQVGTASSQAGTFEANQIGASSNGLTSAEIHEVVIFSKSLTSDEALSVRQDIATRNSITLD